MARVLEVPPKPTSIGERNLDDVNFHVWSVARGIESIPNIVIFGTGSVSVLCVRPRTADDILQKAFSIKSAG